jgi:hypothetical protein
MPLLSMSFWRVRGEHGSPIGTVERVAIGAARRARRILDVWLSPYV